MASVFDGDTIELTDKRKVRYIGIDAPEMNFKKDTPDCFATESAHINEQLVKDKTIEMEKDREETDKYGRLLRYVYIDDLFVNDFLLRQGFARTLTIPPDTKYLQEFKEAEDEARNNKRNLWQSCE